MRIYKVLHYIIVGFYLNCNRIFAYFSALITKMLSALVDLFFPLVCHICKLQLTDNEASLCTTCRHNLPVLNFNTTQEDAIKKLLYGRAKIENGAALFSFEKKGSVQQLIHQLKYKNQQDLGVFLGDWLGEALSKNEAYKNIDIVIPVPLHKKKLKRRGYNQVTKFGQQIAKALQAEYVDNVLIKVTNTASQVNKSRFARWSTNTQLFAMHNNTQINNKHILLVDDIVTTGATLEACIAVLNKADHVKISVATMAIV